MKKVILIILSMLCLLTLVSCSSEESSESVGTKILVEDNTNTSNSENKKQQEQPQKEITFDDFIYAEYKEQNEKNSEFNENLNYYFYTQYDSSTYSKEDRLYLKNVSENICQSLFYGDSYKDKDKTLKYVLSFVVDNTLKEDIKAIFKAKYCELMAATYKDNKVEYDKAKIWSSESYCDDSAPYISTEWSIPYTMYDMYSVKIKEQTNRFHLTFIKKDGIWLLTKVETW